MFAIIVVFMLRENVNYGVNPTSPRNMNSCNDYHSLNYTNIPINHS